MNSEQIYRLKLQHYPEKKSLNNDQKTKILAFHQNETQIEKNQENFVDPAIENKIYLDSQNSNKKSQQKKFGKINKYLKGHQYNYDNICDTKQEEAKQFFIQNKQKSRISDKKHQFKTQGEKQINKKITQVKYQKSLHLQNQSKNMTFGQRQKSQFQQISKFAYTNRLNSYQDNFSKNYFEDGKILKNQFSFDLKKQTALVQNLRKQNESLKIDLRNKNLYIEKLQLRISQYQQRIGELINSKQQIFDSKENDYQKLSQAMRKLQQQQSLVLKYQNTFRKIYKKFDHKPAQKRFMRAFNQNENFILQNLKLVFDQLQELKAYKNLFKKIDQMKAKLLIKNTQKYKKKLERQQQNNEKFQYIDLQSLWKWLKEIGREYKIMKQKLSDYQGKIINFS